MIRSLILVLLWVTCLGSVSGQTLAQIEEKFGTPIKAYSVSAEIWMTPAYDAEGQVCMMRFYPKRISSNTNYLADKFEPEELARVLKELVPEVSRGPLKDGSYISETNGGIGFTDFIYENVRFEFIWPHRTTNATKAEAFVVDPNLPPPTPAEAATFREKLVNSALESALKTARIVVVQWPNRKCPALHRVENNADNSKQQ
jgi:hypothetical protein